MKKNGYGSLAIVRAVLAGLTCFAAGFAGAQASSWTVDRVLDFAPGTSAALGEFASQTDLQEIVGEGEYVFAKADLNDDGQMELIVQAQSSGFCGSGGCFTLVLTQRGGQPVRCCVRIYSASSRSPVRKRTGIVRSLLSTTMESF